MAKYCFILLLTCSIQIFASKDPFNLTEHGCVISKEKTKDHIVYKFESGALLYQRIKNSKLTYNHFFTPDGFHQIYDHTRQRLITKHLYNKKYIEITLSPTNNTVK